MASSGYVACIFDLWKIVIFIHDQKEMEMYHLPQHRSLCVSCFNVQDRSELEKTLIMSRRVKYSL
jgi:hypothetical protein